MYKYIFVLVFLVSAWSNAEDINVTPPTVINDAKTDKPNPPALPAPAFTESAFAETAPFPNAFAFSTDGKIAAYFLLDGNIQIIDSNTLMPLEAITPLSISSATSEDETDYARPQTGSIAINHDGSLLAIGYMNGDLQLYSLTQKKVLRKFVGHRGGIASLAFSPNEKYLASGSDDQTAILWNIDSGKIEHIFDLRRSGNSTATSVSFTGDSNTLVVNEWYSNHYDVDRGITLWDVKLGMEISWRDVASPNSDHTMRAGAALGGKGWLLTYTGRDGQVIERLDQCGSTQKIDTGGYAETVAVDSQGRWVAETSWMHDDGERLSFTSVEQNKTVAAITLPAKSIALYPHPDGRSLVAILFKEVRRNGNEHFIFGRDAETVEVGALYRVPVPEEALQSAAFNPMPAGKACAISEQERLAQNFIVPQSPALLPTAMLSPSKDLFTQIEAKNPSRYSVSHLGWPVDLFFDQTNQLNVLHRSGDDAAGGIAIWDINKHQIVQSNLKEYFDISKSVRLRQGWANQTDEEFRNILTNQTIYSTPPNDKDARTYRVYNMAAFDCAANNFFILPDIWNKSKNALDSEKQSIERYTDDGKPLEKIDAKARIHTFAVKNNLLVIVYAGGDTETLYLNQGTRSVGKSLNGGANEIYPRGINIDNLCKYGCGSSNMSSDGNFLELTADHQSGDGEDTSLIFDIQKASFVREGPLLTPFPAHSNRGVLTDSLTNRLVIWDFDIAQTIARLPRQPSVDPSRNSRALISAISDDGKFVAIGSADGLIRVWDIDAHVLVGEAHADDWVTVMAFNANANTLAAGLRNGNVMLIDLAAPAKAQKTLLNEAVDKLNELRYRYSP